jgi:hypothetical protein
MSWKKVTGGGLLYGERGLPPIEDTHWRRVGRTFGEKLLKNRG